jgi:hypothetical protein
MNAIQPTQSLPPEYHSIGTIDLKNNLRAILWLNLAGLGLFVAAGWAFIQALYLLRPAQAAVALEFNIDGVGGVVQVALAFIALYVVMIVVHEAFHGLFFWIFTRQRPVFALSWAYAYAAAPGWYLPRSQYFITAVAPLAGISVLALLALAFAPPAWFLPALVVAVSNFAGAVGDIWVVIWLLRQPPTCYAQDRGDAVTLFLENK